MLAASSKTLAVGARRCRQWPVPRHISSEATFFSPTCSMLGREFCSSSESKRTIHVFKPVSSIQHSLGNHSAFSTISFDGASFQTNSTPSIKSTNSDKHPSSQAHLQQLSQFQHQPQHPHVHQYQQQIQQWINTNPKIAPYKAEECLAKLWVEQQELLNQLEQQQTSSKLVTQPPILFTTETVNLVLKAWCQSNNGQTGAVRAERLLRWMEDFNSMDHEDSSPLLMKWKSLLPSPDYESYATVIDAWSRAAVYESNHPAIASSGSSNKNGGKAKHSIPEATKVAFECAKHAEDLLMHMQVMHEKQVELQNQQKEGSLINELQPDTHVFHLVLKAWSDIRGGTKASAIRAMRILDLMQELHHCQSLYGGIVAKVHPNLDTYKLLLRAWAHASHTPEGPDRAEEILRHLLSMSKAGNMGADIMPDDECFQIVMKAHAESVRKRGTPLSVVEGDGVIVCSSVERARKVSALLDWMELLALRQNSKIHPSTESYRVALSAWAWSRHVDAPKETERILFRMIRASEFSHDVGILVDEASEGGHLNKRSVVRPETKDFNTVINCCAFTRGVGTHMDEWTEDNELLLKQEMLLEGSYVIAEGVLEALLSSPHAQPDSATFGGMIRACINLLPNTEERDVRVTEIFRLAYNTPAPLESSAVKLSSRMRAPSDGGCVDANVLRQLRHALPSTEDYIRVREEYEEFRNKKESKN